MALRMICVAPARLWTYDSAAALRKYAVPFWRRALRLLLPWKGDGTGLILLKAGLLAAMLLDLLSAGLYISGAGS